MKILITGQTGLAQALANVYAEHQVKCMSVSGGHDINKIDLWGVDFLDYDMVVNCAYDGRGQELVLEYFFEHWKYDKTKTIVTVGSKVITQPRLELALDYEYWAYRQHKQSLQMMHDAMLATARCSMKIVNPGPIDTAMIAHLNITKMPVADLAERIKIIAADPIIKRLDLWL